MIIDFFENWNFTVRKLKVQRITVHPKKVRIKEDLGDGFVRLDYPRLTVPSGTAEFVALTTFRDTIIISAGWQTFLSTPILIDSFPAKVDGRSRWVLKFFNNTDKSVDVEYYAIIKEVAPEAKKRTPLRKKAKVKRITNLLNIGNRKK
ncbi:hypothetical protein ACFQ88_05400 [Paenibacillus sp. NPDC056579]|uniref:hypothetical protein n=1 Tax=Paenibacillus sp. NPDC056579 TaxID=3345871 RepID=UPI0036834E33